MGDRTEELRELFESVTGTETVTERQTDSRGTLASTKDVHEALEAAVERMRENLAFETALSTAQLATVVEGFYDGATDAEIATSLDGAAETVAQARLDLHLVRADERPPESAIDRLEAIEADTETVPAAAAALDQSESTVRRWLAVRATQAERRQVADRYRQAFESALGDRDIAERLTASLEETGMDEAVADQEVDVDM